MSSPRRLVDSTSIAAIGTQSSTRRFDVNRVQEAVTSLVARGRHWRATVAVLVATALTTLGGLALAQPAAATAYNCYGGYINANWAWGTCKGASNGWGGFALTVWCYAWGANTVYGNAPQTVYSHCPWWSHITAYRVYPTSF